MDFTAFMFPYYLIPENYVHWTETPESHIYAADLPGVRKEEIKVELQDSIYLIIRIEAAEGESSEPARRFERKFRLPEMVDINRISAGYTDGILTVTVPRFIRRPFYIERDDLPEHLHALARAA